jgi:hypothetical protein
MLMSATSSSMRPIEISGRGVVSRSDTSLAGPLVAAEALPAIDKDNPTIPIAGAISLRRFSFEVRGIEILRHIDEFRPVDIFDELPQVQFPYHTRKSA